MKKAYFLIVLSLVLWAKQGRCQRASIDVSEVKKCMNLQQDAWNKGSLEGFMAYYWKSDSLQFIGHKGITLGWQQTLDNYKKTYASKEAMGQLSFEVLGAEQLSKHFVFVVGKWTVKTSDRESGGYYTLLWKKIKGKWVIITDHTS
ncbi:MAG: YybH family protein [Bacteroidia bacterium]